MYHGCKMRYIRRIADVAAVLDSSYAQGIANGQRCIAAATQRDMVESHRYLQSNETAMGDGVEGCILYGSASGIDSGLCSTGTSNVQRMTTQNLSITLYT